MCMYGDQNRAFLYPLHTLNRHSFRLICSTFVFIWINREKLEPWNFPDNSKYLNIHTLYEYRQIQPSSNPKNSARVNVNISAYQLADHKLTSMHCINPDLQLARPSKQTLDGIKVKDGPKEIEIDIHWVNYLH